MNITNVGRQGRSQGELSLGCPQPAPVEYAFIQGPGARVVVMVPTWDGKMYQWHSTATKLDLSGSSFVRRQGETPTLESFLQTALEFAPATIPNSELSQN